MKEISSKKWTLAMLIITWSIFIGCAALVIIIDPYLHYRIPDNGLNYYVHKQRYINDGFVRLYDYNAIISGTSMTENFKTSEFDELFGVNSIKIPFSGASYKEVNNACNRALEMRSDIKIIVRSLDLSVLVADKDYMRYEHYPEYLYNDDLLDDVNYWLNKMVIVEDCMQNVIGHSLVTKWEGTFVESFSFDEYSRWQDSYIFGKERVLSDYVRPEKSNSVIRLTDDEKETIYGNITQNVTDLARQYPDTRFILFFTPYSIVFWDSLVREGRLEWEIEAQRIAIEEILKCDNVELYSFCNDFETVCNLDKYKDETHYDEEINSRILVCMQNGDYKLAWDNYENYLNEIYDFYSNYNYDSIFR